MADSSLHLLIRRFTLFLRAERNASTHTLRAYQHDLIAFHRFLQKQKMTWSPSADHRTLLRHFLASLHEQSLKRSSLMRVHACLRSFYKFCVREKIVEQTPFAGLPMPKREKPLPRFLSEQEMQELVVSPSEEKDRFSTRDTALLEILYSSGIRIHELSQLNVEDVDLWEGMVRVFGKGSRERIVPIGQTAQKAVQAYLQAGNRTDARPGTPLFLNKSGGRLTDRGARMIVQKWVERSSLRKRVSPHVFRHSFATHLLNRGCDLRSVQEMLGHQNLITTQNYTHVTAEHLRRVYEKAHPHAT